jgi:hypothetical protein
MRQARSPSSFVGSARSARPRCTIGRPRLDRKNNRYPVSHVKRRAARDLPAAYTRAPGPRSWRVLPGVFGGQARRSRRLRPGPVSIRGAAAHAYAPQAAGAACSGYATVRPSKVTRVAPSVYAAASTAARLPAVYRDNKDAMVASIRMRWRGVQDRQDLSVPVGRQGIGATAPPGAPFSARVALDQP